MNPKTITIIGAGRVGGALAIALARAGHNVEKVIVRNRGAAKHLDIFPESAVVVDWSDDFEIGSGIILITTQDNEIASAADLARKFMAPGRVILHTSGALSSEILAGLREIGGAVGSMHPLVSISDPEMGSARFRGTYFCVEGDEAAVNAGKQLATDLGGLAFSIPPDSKPLYHAAAVVACGHLVALIDVSLELLRDCGLSAETSREILLPLVRSTVENLAERDTPSVLTGPYARGDIETIDRHLAALAARSSVSANEVYLVLAERSLELAAKAGADEQRLRTLRERILLAKTNLKC